MANPSCPPRSPGDGADGACRVAPTALQEADALLPVPIVGAIEGNFLGPALDVVDPLRRQRVGRVHLGRHQDPRVRRPGER